MKPMKLLRTALLLLLVCSLLFSVISCKKKKKNGETAEESFELVSTADPTFDYYHSDLSAYLAMTRENYLNLRVSLDVTDADVDEYINDQLLPSYRTPAMWTDRAVKNGDKVYIYYTGYTDNFPFDDGSNASDSKPFEFVVGSGDFFFAELENQLIGKIPANVTTEEPFVTADVVVPAEHTVPKYVEYDTEGTETDYSNAKLAGKTARFKIVIDGIVEGENVVTDRAIQAGDKVQIHYTGYADNYAFNGGSNADDDEPAELEIGSGSFIPGFEEKLIDKIPADTSKENPCTIEVTFPDDYRATDLAGKDARFDVVIKGIFAGTYNIPELTEQFIVEKIKFETDEENVIAAFRLDVKNWMRQNKVDRLRNHKLIRTMEELFKVLDFEDAYPEGEADRFESQMNDEVTYYYTYYNYMYYMYYGYTPFEDIDDAGRWYYGLRFDADWEEYQHNEAMRIVRQMMVLNMIARLEGLTVTEEDVRTWILEKVTERQEQLDSQAEQAGSEAETATPADVLAEYSVEEIYSQLASQKAQEFILANITFDYGDLPVTEEATAN
ncbi:MAG: FKBP-type peptidyl-prolyl cis-trans isomerase [Clostridia bacterium]|nr:FKBP-type peptidyl-prolyl cis-trans isomerase [Clostridia bacterium]MBR5044552.1 FKBP-type peptidyl-prolyl cis-trans isomerase [Clostridia bacterium]